jgi:hypothetical protein
MPKSNVQKQPGYAQKAGLGGVRNARMSPDAETQKPTFSPPKTGKTGITPKLAKCCALPDKPCIISTNS